MYTSATDKQQTEVNTFQIYNIKIHVSKFALGYGIKEQENQVVN